jgi:protein TonB
MFDRTLTASWDERSRRALTALTSFGLQALAVGVLLVLPLLRPQGLPSFHQLTTPISLGQPVGDLAPVRARTGASAAEPSHPTQIIFRGPSQMPHEPVVGDEGPPGLAVGPSIGGPGSGDQSGIANALGIGPRPIMPVPAPAAVVAPLRVSHMNEGNLIRKVQPVYPPLARSARIQGVVELQAVISKAGSIENLRVLTGHPMLVSAAVEAVRQWRYRPYILNNEPVEVETQITVNFSLSGNGGGRE